jgi:hypothetical protein
MVAGNAAGVRRRSPTITGGYTVVHYPKGGGAAVAAGPAIYLKLVVHGSYWAPTSTR